MSNLQPILIPIDAKYWALPLLIFKKDLSGVTYKFMLANNIHSINDLRGFEEITRLMKKPSHTNIFSKMQKEISQILKVEALEVKLKEYLAKPINQNTGNLILPQKMSGSFEANLINLIDSLLDIMEQKNPMYKSVFIKHLGWGGAESYTLDQIATQYKVSHDGIRYYEVGVLKCFAEIFSAKGCSRFKIIAHPELQQIYLNWQEFYRNNPYYIYKENAFSSIHLKNWPKNRLLQWFLLTNFNRSEFKVPGNKITINFSTEFFNRMHFQKLIVEIRIVLKNTSNYISTNDLIAILNEERRGKYSVDLVKAIISHLNFIEFNPKNYDQIRIVNNTIKS